MTVLDDDNLTAQRLQSIAALQAARDRAKLLAVQVRAEALEDRVRLLERSLSWRAGGPARRVIRALRRLQLRRSDTSMMASTAPASDRAGRGLALVIDHHWPMPDRDSGSVDIVNLVHALTDLGFDTILAASREHEGSQPARERLLAQGVRCLVPEDADSVEVFVRTRGASLDLCVMCRVYCGGEFFERLRLHAPQARIVFNSIDLHYLREERRARIIQDNDLLVKVRQLREREEHLVRNSDATLVVSTVERDLLAAAMPSSLVVHMPLAREPKPPRQGFAERSGIGFIGGFAHAPNVDAVRYFLDDIWPLVQEKLPGCVLSIVGADAPDGLAAGSSNVDVLGHLQDIDPWFESLRVTVAPLRYGAGAKGKVASSLARGVPCIATSLASEGMTLAEHEAISVQDSPADFATAIVDIYTHEASWQKLSLAGLEYVDKMLSPDRWQQRLDATLRLLGL